MLRHLRHYALELQEEEKAANEVRIFCRCRFCDYSRLSVHKYIHVTKAWQWHSLHLIAIIPAAVVNLPTTCTTPLFQTAPDFLEHACECMTRNAVTAQ